MSKSKFYDGIKEAVIERTVEDVYNKGINLYFPSGITYPFACDGFVDTKTDNGKVLKLIIEYKFNEVMTNNVARAKVLIQVIYYIKRFEQNGFVLPNVCMVGDKDECFVMHTNELLKYLDENIDWNIAPSNAAVSNPDLVLKISQDENINPFIFHVDEHFSFKYVANKIKDLADNIQRYVRVTEHNLSKIFDYFCKNVLKGKTKMQGQELVGIFMGVIGDKMNYYQHPVDSNILVCHGKHINIDGNAFKAFFGYFDRTYTPQETMRLNSIADRLIEDVDRRMKGDFWTPTLFVDYAHQMIESELGEDWKEKYIVWDNCWGTGNLTRDYKFSELYCSTLFQSELNIGEDYNPEAEKFQFDFLNDDIPMPNELISGTSKLPHGLFKALQQNNPIVFFLNPPYARNSGGGINKGTSESVAFTKVNTQMKNENIGNCSSNLYAQFLYRIMKIKQEFSLTNCYIAVFCPTLLLTGQSFKLFRNLFLNEFSFIKAFQFKASEFADVAPTWGIGFTLFKCGKSDDKDNFQYGIAESDGEEIKIENYKTVYNADNISTVRCSEWIREPVNGIKTIDTINLTSAINVRQNDGVRKGMIIPNALGYLFNSGNNVDGNDQGCSFFTGASARGIGCSVIESNFIRCTALFSARKLIAKNWINSKDEYLAPDETNPKYNEFINDSIVYSLFHSSSNQSSLRQIEYKEKKWDIYNEFFWMSKAEIMQLANDNNFSECYNDARTSKDRYVYKKLQTITLSAEAQAVLDKANEIVRNTFRYRGMFCSEHPEYQIMNWDCGWYQIKALAKEYKKSEYDEFSILFKKLEEKMRPMVYELGFLK